MPGFMVEHHQSGRQVEVESVDGFILDFAPYGFIVAADQPPGYAAPLLDDIIASLERAGEPHRTLRMKAFGIAPGWAPPVLPAAAMTP